MHIKKAIHIFIFLVFFVLIVVFCIEIIIKYDTAKNYQINDVFSHAVRVVELKRFLTRIDKIDNNDKIVRSLIYNDIKSDLIYLNHKYMSDKSLFNSESEIILLNFCNNIN
ncbi:hypothetical protein J3R75_000105 [Oligosphaera ethanolica]|jgi:hypothetical protein|uniref:Uncharacterized protein n=1 Tax=Oligosphaera ethanolica TaxID=760260 RepID=A0AAE4AML9_9BACT|nr:hypothetical protein [Oligosphaera ethanolica]